MGLPEAERGQESGQRERRDDGARRFTVDADETPRVSITMINGALRVLGDAEADEVTVRAVKPNGEAVPVDLVAETQSRLNGEITIKARPAGDIHRQVRRLTKAFDGRRGDFFENLGEMTTNLGEMIDTLAAMKTLGNNLDRVRLEVTVPRRCDVALTTSSGPIQVGRIEGSVAVQSASGNIDCARIGGKLAAKSASGNLRLGEITGTASVQTASGDVTTRGIDGDLVIQTMSGDAQGHDLAGQVGFKSHSGSLIVRDSHLSGFYLNTTSGECLVEAALGAGEYEVRTVSGDITLRPQPDLSAILSGRTVSGSFRCALPHRHADEDWRAPLDDDEFDGGREGGFAGPEIDLPGLRIGKDGIDVGGFLRIDDDSVQMPGMRINLHNFRHGVGHEVRHGREQEGRRERRRGRNRWEYLLGDPARAVEGETRLRVRTVSGDLTLRAGRGEATSSAASDTSPRAAEQTAATHAATIPTTEADTARDRRGWPDTELWPTGMTPPTPPVAAAAPVPPIPPVPPFPPLAPEGPLPPAPPVLPTVPTYAADTVAPDSTLNDTAAPVAKPVPSDSTVEADATAQADPPAVIALPAPERTATPTEAPLAAGDADDDSATAQPNGEQARLEILEALRGGEITTDEALLLLRQLDT